MLIRQGEADPIHSKLTIFILEDVHVLVVQHVLYVLHDLSVTENKNRNQDDLNLSPITLKIYAKRRTIWSCCTYYASK